VSISNKYLFLIEEAARNAGKTALEAFQSSSMKKRYKSAKDLVTDIDEKIEIMLIKDLGDIDPVPFLSEEFNPETEIESPVWIVDPIDGTTNFAAGIAPFCISIAHWNGESMDAGVCYLPVTDEMFTAFLGYGAFLNGKPISVDSESDPEKIVAATGFADITHNNKKTTLNVFNSLILKTRALRRLGSAATDLVYTACGKFSFFYEAGLSPWDVAAGSLIVREAGGVVTDFLGGEDYIKGKTIIASNPEIYGFIKNEIDRNYSEKQTEMEEKNG
jgi:myo-inositol-1(or 4)-monophosphatase